MQATVRDAMTTDVVTARRHLSVVDAERMLLAAGVDELFVLDDQNCLCGVVPDYQLLKCRFDSTSSRVVPATVESVMSRRFLVIGADSPLAVAGRYLREHFHSRLAVVEGRRLLGRVTRRSVLARLAASSDAESCPEQPVTNHEPDDLNQLEQPIATMGGV